MTYDSEFERNTAPTLEALGFVRSNDYFRLDGQPQQFRDKTGATFSARPDWHHPDLDLYLETKSATLNTKTTVKTAASAVARAEHECRLRGQPFSTYHMLQNQFSHSRYKQAAVQSVLTPQRLVVVFAERVPYATMMAYAKVGLVAIHLAALPQYLNYIRLVRRGLPVQWNLPYPEHSATFVLCPPGELCVERANLFNHCTSVADGFSLLAKFRSPNHPQTLVRRRLRGGTVAQNVPDTSGKSP